MNSPSKEFFVSICRNIGPPAKYDAIPNCKTNSTSLFRIFTFGEPSADVEEKTLLLVGGSGTGKSTLINSLFNYIIGVDWEDDRRYDFIQDEPQALSQSKTQNFKAYRLHHKEGYRIQYSLTVIDSPGFNNTSKDLTDEKITNQLRKILKEEKYSHIDAVAFVLPTSLPRFGDVEKHFYRTLQDSLGNNIHTNLYFLVTFADHQKPPAVNAILECGIPQPKCVKFNNCALFSGKRKEASEKQDEEAWEELYWKIVYNGCQDLLERIRLLERKPSAEKKSKNLLSLCKGRLYFL